MTPDTTAGRFLRYKSRRIRARIQSTGWLVCCGLALGLAFGLRGIAQQPEAGRPQAAAAARVRVDANPTFVLRQFAPDKPLRLIVYGDMRFTDPKITDGTNPKVRSWLAAKIGQEKPQALLLTGDMPFTGARAEDWAEYHRETALWAQAGFPVFPTIGNHEIKGDPVKGAANYLANFPEIQGHRYYSAVLGPVEVIALDMILPANPHSEQYRWFAAQLAHVPASVEFVFVLYHTPWVADTQSQMIASLPTRDGLALRTLLEEHVPKMRAKVVMFSGHIHNYERFEQHGVEYVVTGGGGAQPYPLLYRGVHDLYRDPGFPVFNYVTVEIRNHALHAGMWKVADPDAAVSSVVKKDSFSIEANAAQPASAGKTH